MTHTGTQPEGPHRFLFVHPPLLHSIHDLIRQAPLNLLYSIAQYQSNVLTPIRKNPQPPYFLNMAYLMYTSTCGCTPTNPNTPPRCAFFSPTLHRVESDDRVVPVIS